MSDNKGTWDQVFDQLTDPLDWIAAGFGALIGGAITVVAHGTDLGTSVGAGALVGVTARKALSRARVGKRLRKRADGLARELESRKGSSFEALSTRLSSEVRLWETRVTSNEDFGVTLDAIVRDYRALWK